MPSQHEEEGAEHVRHSDIVRRAFVPEDVSYLPEDNYYKDFSNLPLRERNGMDWDSPAAKDLPRLAVNLKQLRAGQPVFVREYDFANHAPGKRVTEIKPAPVVLVEGIHCLGYHPIRELLDLSVFVEVDEQDRLKRRLKRDQAERGRRRLSIVGQWMSTVQPACELFVDP